jgi:DNA-binding transcriptional LysR family regulator
VHRGAETSFDISADLQELAQTGVAVVCAGVKSILDIGLTLEYLETHGVPVVSVGQPGFPAFFTRDSGFNADFQLDTPEEQARFIRTKWQLGLQGGVVVSNPVPEAASAMPNEEIDAIIAQALDEANAQGVKGKAVTPFLLARIKELTGGRSLATNIALVKHNALVGARWPSRWARRRTNNINQRAPMSIDLKQLKYFLAVAEEKSFSRAAERLHISQPPLSQQIMKLESELGVRLFARTTRSFELTVAGKALMQEAADLLGRMRMTIDTIRQIDRGEVGRLRVGIVGSAMWGPIPGLLEQFQSQYPARDLDHPRTRSERPVGCAARAPDRRRLLARAAHRRGRTEAMPTCARSCASGERLRGAQPPPSAGAAGQHRADRHRGRTDADPAPGPVGRAALPDPVLRRRRLPADHLPGSGRAADLAGHGGGGAGRGADAGDNQPDRLAGGALPADPDQCAVGESVYQYPAQDDAPVVRAFLNILHPSDE